MQLLEPHDLPLFLDRFCSLYDAVLKRLEHEFRVDGAQLSKVELLVQDAESAAGWSNMTLSIANVSELLFREGASTRQVLSDGITILWKNQHVWCDLSPYASTPTSIEEIRRSDFYLVGTSISWSVSPYNDA